MPVSYTHLEDGINAMLPDKLPKNIQKLYDEGTKERIL